MHKDNFKLFNANKGNYRLKRIKSINDLYTEPLLMI